MKSAAKVFIILSMIFLFPLIFPLVIGIIALGKINDESTKRDDAIVFSIITMVFCSLLGGLFWLLDIVSHEENYDNKVVDAKYEEEPLPEDEFERIKKAKALLDDGAITQEEYDKIKKDALK